MVISSPCTCVSSLDLLTDLRVGTQALHVRLERRLDLNSRLSTLDNYRKLLKRYFQYYAPLEEELNGPSCSAMWKEIGIEYAPRSKSPLLKADLHFLGHTDLEIDRLDRCQSDHLPKPESCAELIGTAYVIEGATLGGQYIARQITKTLGLAAGAVGAQFFFGYGRETAEQWKQFRLAAIDYVNQQELSHIGAGRAATEIAVESARSAFVSIDKWFVSEVE